MDERRRRFCKLIVAGMGKRDAAVEAGYTERNAGVTASKLMQQSAVKNEIAKLRKELDARIQEDEAARLKDNYESSLELLKDVYNNPKLPFAMRYKAAVDALPYEHGKIGPKGKKKDKSDDAAAAAAGKYAVGKRPALRAVS